MLPVEGLRARRGSAPPDLEGRISTRGRVCHRKSVRPPGGAGPGGASARPQMQYRNRVSGPLLRPDTFTWRSPARLPRNDRRGAGRVICNHPSEGRRGETMPAGALPRSLQREDAGHMYMSEAVVFFHLPFPPHLCIGEVTTVRLRFPNIARNNLVSICYDVFLAGEIRFRATHFQEAAGSPLPLGC